MSSPVSRAAMPLEALHTATSTPTISAVVPAEARVLAVWTACDKTPDAPGGSAVFRPLTSRWTVLVPVCSNATRPSSAMSAGNRARNQW
jgi:hypothetical protein